MAKARYCEMCDKWVGPVSQRECRACGAPTSKPVEYCAACDREGATAGSDTTPLEFHACQDAVCEHGTALDVHC